MRNDEELTLAGERLEALTGRALAVSHLFTDFEVELHETHPSLRIDWSIAARCLRRAGGVVSTAVAAYLRSV